MAGASSTRFPPTIRQCPRRGSTAATTPPYGRTAPDWASTSRRVPRPAGKGFHVQPRRWIVDRTFGWLMQHRRLVRDHETLPQRTRTMIHWTMANTMSRHLTGESTPTWRSETT
ncbi:transposase [Micromonospora coxensis]|uniref:transposase n=1 Tax=Micromonospora coxensis TaxID=356852 RepID=UPI003F579652